MTDETAPSLADDEAALGRYGQQLITSVEAVAAGWLQRLVATHAPGLEGRNDVATALSDAAVGVVDELRTLLERDIADQLVGPLEILRRAVGVPTAILAEAAAPPVSRDEFSRTNFPDDVYALTPASFADIDPTLHEPGLMWGAAKAHVHLRRRREAETQAAPAPQTAAQIVVLSADLMDRSKISAAFPDATFVRSPAKLAETAADADLVLVDLGRIGDPAALASIEARVVAFGSHVNEAELEAAAEAGAEALPRSVFFRRIESGAI